MRASLLEYANKVTLPMQKDGNKGFCDDYPPLNTQTWKDAYPMPLIDDVLSQMGSAGWFIALDLHSGFWHIRMNYDDVKKMMFIIKTCLYEWLVMPLGF
jgi:hypothetical protein